MKFTLDREVRRRDWSVKVNYLGARDDSSGFGNQWSESFVARPAGSHAVVASIFIPAHLTPTTTSTDDDRHMVLLKLESGRLYWMFHLRTGHGPLR